MNDPAQQGWKARDLPGFFGSIGPIWTKNEDDAWSYGVLATAAHLNPAGVVHGGMLATLLDHTVSVIVWEASGRKPCVTVSLDVHFLAPARPGEFVQARARITRKASSLAFVQGSLHVDERVVATASAIIKIQS